MGTSLSAITNFKRSGKETADYFDSILTNFKNLNLVKSMSWEGIEDDREYCYYEHSDCSVYFENPSPYTFTLYHNIGIIDTIYRYSLLYRKDFYWFDNFRRDLYNIMKIMGGTEIIFLADNGCDKLAYYLECMAWEDIPYEIIKDKMIEELGNPKPFRYLSRYNNNGISAKTEEFFLDDFDDFNLCFME